VQVQHSLVTAATAAVHTPAGGSGAPLPSSHASSAFSAAFNPGDTLLNRYRIVARLGKGGMGEVYRADDLALGAPVALKFLPPEFAADPLWTERFRAEVRLARQISHPNVCRVYDIAELPMSLTGGAGTPGSSSPAPVVPRLFLAMEYIDGEDLASLLRRIGRLPHDKAVQISRQICFGLAAAHDAGVVHRDLKPANIMIDGRGNARVTDFGLAGLVEQFEPPSPSRAGAPAPSHVSLAGTPAYMAPEQLAGRGGGEVSKRSDIYALGLVLYELFTGKRAVTGSSLDELRTATRLGTRPTRPSEHIADLDPAVERVILRCLEPDPANRPQSAIAVAAALPGGDPLAAALAAGETPSPELVAQSGEVGVISARAAALGLAGIVLVLLLCVFACDRALLLNAIPLPLPPDALAAKARELSLALGNTAPLANEAFGYSNEPGVVQWVGRLPPEQRRAVLAKGAPPAVSFWFRQSPDELLPAAWWRRGVTLVDPPWRDPGQVVMVLGPRGQLLRYSRVAYDAGFGTPPANLTEASTPGASPPPPPAALDVAVRATGLDPGALTPAEPLRTPGVGSDRRYAFITLLPNAPPELGSPNLRIEAAALADQLVSFTLVGPWERLAAGADERPVLGRIAENVGGLLLAAGLIAAALLARANLRKRRSDTRGAVALGVAMFGAEFGAMVLPRHTLAGMLTYDLIGRPIARSLWVGVLIVLLYIALEPIVRKRNPGTIISWARLVTGDWRSPRIGRDLLLGLGLGGAFALVVCSSYLLSSAMGDSLRSIYRPDLTTLSGSLFIASTLLAPVSGAVVITLATTLLVVGVEALVRRRAIAYPVVTVLMFLVLFGSAADTPLGAAVGLLGAIALMFTLARVGILGAMAYLYTVTILVNTPLVASLSKWTAAPGVGAVAALAALAAFAAYRASLGFQPGTPAPIQRQA
jgi:hypothetical protein